MDPTDKGAQDPEDDYASSEDEDFNPTEVGAHDDEDVSASSGDEEIPATAAAPKARKSAKKRKQADADQEAELDSGDEATIQEFEKKKRRKKAAAAAAAAVAAVDDGDSGGEGGLIKTRAQRRAEKEEKAEFRRADKGRVTVDIDALWAKLSSAPVGRRPPTPPASDRGTTKNDTEVTAAADTHPDDGDEGMITIHRTYDFAGQTITEEKRVPKNSAEAKLYLATHDPAKSSKKTIHPQTDGPDAASAGPQLRRPLRRVSKFEPNPTGEVKGLAHHLQRLRTPTRADVQALSQRKEDEDKRKGKVQRLTTVQKSAYDWAAHVDKEGLKEELHVYGKSKHGFLGRMDFIRGVEGRKEEEGRRVRLATSAAQS